MKHLVRIFMAIALMGAFVACNNSKNQYVGTWELEAVSNDGENWDDSIVMSVSDNMFLDINADGSSSTTVGGMDSETDYWKLTDEGTVEMGIQILSLDGKGHLISQLQEYNPKYYRYMRFVKH